MFVQIAAVRWAGPYLGGADRLSATNCAKNLGTVCLAPLHPWSAHVRIHLETEGLGSQIRQSEARRQQTVAAERGHVVLPMIRKRACKSL
ncbi:hypothetical protein GCM10007385_13540 [Tateyamaria omphalii]|nr:hypothetical protein GCM10007385_13540 [Tateyamaria omphalii]